MDPAWTADAGPMLVVCMDENESGVVTRVRRGGEEKERERDGIKEGERMKMMVKEGEGVSGFCLMRAQEEKEYEE